MGKCKKRILNKNTDNSSTVLKRHNVISNIINNIRNNKLNDETQKLISLFGITIEELTEAGASFEEIKAVKPFIF